MLEHNPEADPFSIDLAFNSKVFYVYHSGNKDENASSTESIT